MTLKVTFVVWNYSTGNSYNSWNMARIY